jgi:hypothetical protein
MKYTGEFNEVSLESVAKYEENDKKLDSTNSTATTARSQSHRKDLEAAFLMPHVHRQQ